MRHKRDNCLTHKYQARSQGQCPRAVGNAGHLGTKRELMVGSNLNEAMTPDASELRSALAAVGGKYLEPISERCNDEKHEV